MNIDDLTVAEAREISKMFSPQAEPAPAPSASHSFRTGQTYLIRTVTMTYTGRVVFVTDSDVTLRYAAWIADTGRFADALKTGKLNEIEPYVNDCIVSRAAIVDFTVWGHNLPCEQK